MESVQKAPFYETTTKGRSSSADFVSEITTALTLFLFYFSILYF